MNHAGESPLLSRSGGEKGLRGSGAGTLGVPLGGTRRVGGLLGVAGIEPFNFSFFSVTGWGIGLDYRDIEWFALEMNRDHSVVFEIADMTEPGVPLRGEASCGVGGASRDSAGSCATEECPVLTVAS